MFHVETAAERAAWLEAIQVVVVVIIVIVVIVVVVVIVVIRVIMMVMAIVVIMVICLTDWEHGPTLKITDHDFKNIFKFW